MYKVSIVLSMLCMPLISFGMDSGFANQSFNDFDMMLSTKQDLFALEQRTLPDAQGSNDAELQAAICSLFANDDSSVSSQNDVNTQELHFPDLQSIESGVLYCDELLGNEADKEDAQSSALYGYAMPQHMQARYDAINMQESNDAELQMAICSLFANDDSSVSSQNNVNPQGLHFPDLRSTESGVLYCDELLGDEVGKGDAQLPALYGDSMPQHMQARYDAIDTQGLNDPELQTAICSLFANDDSSVSSQSDVNTQGLHFPDLQPAQIDMLGYDELFDYEEVQPTTSDNASMLQKIQKRYAENRKKCPLVEVCSRIFKSDSGTVYHVAAMHYICLLCKPPLSYEDRAKIVEHFTQKHSKKSFQKEACKKCGKVINCAYLQTHTAGCKGRNDTKYASSELKELRRAYMKNKKQCPIKSCLKSTIEASSTADHAAALHNICLLCNPPYNANAEDMKQHFKELHPSADYAVRNTKTACKQCGKEIAKPSMARHLREACKKRTGSDVAATTSDKN